MLKLIGRRLLLLIPVLLGATFIVFAIMHFAEGDPGRAILGLDALPEQVEALNQELGVYDPLLVRYGRYILNLVQGDMGTSYKNGASVASEIANVFGNTLTLSLVAIAISIIIALPLGILAALHRNSLIDHGCMIVSMLGMSMPGFWIGVLLILFFGLKLDWLPISGMEDGLMSFILPAFTISLRPMAAIARTARSSMLDELSQDYLQTARSKGIAERAVIISHALKNSLIPTITIVGLQLGSVLAGSVAIETVFSWPGMGRLMLQAINSRDIPIVMGCVVVFVIMITVINLLVDILYGFVDPRFRSKV